MEKLNGNKMGHSQIGKKKMVPKYSGKRINEI